MHWRLPGRLLSIYIIRPGLVGAQDDISSGRSTFMVEMEETANILNHATGRSLIILDEIGRGTSASDALAIARAVVEYIHNSPRLGRGTGRHLYGAQHVYGGDGGDGQHIEPRYGAVAYHIGRDREGHVCLRCTGDCQGGC